MRLAMCRTNRLEGFIARPLLPEFISGPVYPVRMLHCHGNHLFTENQLRRGYIYSPEFDITIASKPASYINGRIYLPRTNRLCFTENGKHLINQRENVQVMLS